MRAAAARSGTATEIEAIRSFNRFYTQEIGVLQEGLLDSTFSLAEARELAREARKKRLAGENPIKFRAREREQHTEVKNLTFEECTERYIDANKAGWKWQGAEAAFKRSFAKHVYPVVGSRAENTPNPMTAREINREIVLVSDRKRVE